MSFQRTSPDVSPLEAARARLGLTLSEIGARLGCSVAAASRYLGGSRTPPPALFLILGGPSLAEEHEAWLRATGRKRERGAVAIELVTKLPAGVSVEQARAVCAQALADLWVEREAAPR